MLLQHSHPDYIYSEYSRTEGSWEVKINAEDRSLA